ncbi:Methyltransferase type 11 [Parafrankia sp. EAN1pec]|uniref:class I SAM-dependent methyltransferase n=1 Tax=Parafrankia sp. (strain EAN1pec) TaxID=298653 RepID=UPI0000542A51|nr:Methyltransferase type 11 [Frankia sp. EAN1pec]
MPGHADPVAASTAAWEQHAQKRIAAGDIDERPAVHRFRWTRTGVGDPGIEILGDLQGKRVVELGCGAGDNLAYLVDHCGARGIGIDPAPSQIYRARTRWPNPIFHCTDAVSYLATCGPVDVFYSVFGAVGRCPPEALFRQIHERLKPGGRLVFSLLDESSAVRSSAEHEPGLRGSYQAGLREWLERLRYSAFPKSEVSLADESLTPSTLIFSCARPGI